MGVPFAVGSNGQSVQTAVGPDALLSVKNPLTKLDVTNIESFQTIQLLLNHEPPQAPASAPFYTDTVVYPFKHNYTYVPAVWMEYENPSANPSPGTPGLNSSNMITYPNGDDSASAIAYDATQGTIDIGVEGSALAVEQYNSSGSGLFNATDALLYVTADKTNVYLHVMKRTLVTVGAAIVPIFLIGFVINIRVYVFVEPGTTSTY